MRSQVIFLEVVPPSSKDRYERSLIGQLSLTSSGPAKANDPPPPVKAKPAFKPPENLTSRQTEEPNTPEPAVRVSFFITILKKQIRKQRLDDDA